MFLIQYYCQVIASCRTGLTRDKNTELINRRIKEMCRTKFLSSSLRNDIILDLVTNAAASIYVGSNISCRSPSYQPGKQNNDNDESMHSYMRTSLHNRCPHSPTHFPLSLRSDRLLFICAKKIGTKCNNANINDDNAGSSHKALRNV